MKKKLVFLFLALLATRLVAQNNAYTDVAVIVNDNSPTSLAIGNYFAQQRGIPQNRILHVSTTTALDIDSSGFAGMRAQIEAALIVGNLLDSVQYLVTTKGMPARASVRLGCDSLNWIPNAVNRCICVESQLSMILGPLASNVLERGGADNPYADNQVPTLQHFDRDSFGIFLVSRLDGFTEENAKQLVDHGGPNQPFVIADAEIVLDLSGHPLGNGNAPMFASMNTIVADEMIPFGYQVTNDSDHYSFVPYAPNVITYVGMHRADTSLPRGINMDYVAGSSAHLLLDLGPIAVDDPERYTAGDAIAQGAGVVTGLTSSGFNSPNYFAYRFLSVYNDTSTGTRYNAAEAFYRSQSMLGHQSVLYGDPKTSISPAILLAADDPQVQQFAIYPNPTAGQFTIQLSRVANAHVQVMDLQGKVLITSQITGSATLDLDANQLQSGIYLVQVRDSTGVSTRKLSVVR